MHACICLPQRKGAWQRAVAQLELLEFALVVCDDVMAAAINLANKTFVITGGNSGLGLETARALVHRNAHVVIASKTQHRGDAAVQELRKEASADAIVECMQIDLASFR